MPPNGGNCAETFARRRTPPPHLAASLSRLSMHWMHNGTGPKAAVFQAALQFGLAVTGIVKASLTSSVRKGARCPSRPWQNYSQHRIVVLPHTFRGACWESANNTQTQCIFSIRFFKCVWKKKSGVNSNNHPLSHPKRVELAYNIQKKKTFWCETLAQVPLTCLLTGPAQPLKIPNAARSLTAAPLRCRQPPPLPSRSAMGQIPLACLWPVARHCDVSHLSKKKKKSSAGGGLWRSTPPPPPLPRPTSASDSPLLPACWMI